MIMIIKNNKNITYQALWQHNQYQLAMGHYQR